MPITASLSSSAPAKVNADVLAVPGLRRPGARPGRQGARHRRRRVARRLHGRGRIRGQGGGDAGRAGRQAQRQGRPARRARRQEGRLGRRIPPGAAALVRRSPKAKTVATTLLDTVPTGGDRVAAAQAVAEGAALGTYKFLRYKQKSESPALEKLVRARQEGRQGQPALDRGMAVAGAVAWARDLVNEPAGAMTPIAARR